MVPAAKQISLTPSSAEFIFDGLFNGNPVVWRCQLFTLASLAQRDRKSRQRQFIEILPQVTAQQDEASQQIIVGLNVPAIDAAVIEKTVIMIRNYRRLRLGRHEYGEVVEYPVD